MGYTVIDNSFITDNRLDSVDFHIGCILKSMCFGNKNTCFPSEKLIAQNVHKSIRTVQRHLKHLVQLGYIKIKRRGSISNLYTILFKEIPNAIKTTVKKITNNFNPKKSISTFNSFTCNRNYDFKSLESKLLGWEKKYE